MKIGYKATNNMKCETLTYEVGKVYEISSMEMCSYGFHFCEKMIDVSRFYIPSKDFVLLECEILGNVNTEGVKSVTDSIKILRVIPLDEHQLFEVDVHGNVTYLKSSDGIEYWKEYDSNNNLIHYKQSDGYEYWKEYDSNNNCIYFKNSSGCEYWEEYDSNNNLIHLKNSKGYEEWKTYDSNNNLISYRDSNGIEWKITVK